MQIPVGIATAIDTLCILEIKKEKFAQHPEKLNMVMIEIAAYGSMIDDVVAEYPALTDLMNRLHDVHLLLWDIEDKKRAIESGDNADALIDRLCTTDTRELLEEYITLSRNVSKYNDERASIKNTMNRIAGSVLHEVKSHKTVTESL